MIKIHQKQGKVFNFQKLESNTTYSHAAGQTLSN